MAAPIPQQPMHCRLPWRAGLQAAAKEGGVYRGRRTVRLSPGGDTEARDKGAAACSLHITYSTLSRVALSGCGGSLPITNPVHIIDNLT